jgi:large subunit ribosomal protein L2
MFKFYTILRNKGGRNNQGVTTVRHKGYRTNPKVSVNYFNFRQFSFSSFAKNKPGSLATSFVSYKKNIFNFIFSKSTTRPLQLFQFSPGSFVCNIESYPGSGSCYVRAPYSRAIIIRRLGTNSVVKIPSGEIRKFKAICFGYQSLNDSFFSFKRPLLKAGASRNLGIRPHVRGCAINPVDHPHGGRTGESRPSVSPWAKLTKGYRTRLVKKNKKIVVLSVQELKNKKQNKKRN